MKTIEISKFDAIRSQLDAAIELFFTSENIVATHTLAAAAYNALKDIAKKEGAIHPFLKTIYIQSLPEDEQRRTIRYLNDPENFFKHADKDPGDTLTFNPELTEILLMDACAYFRSSSEEKPKYYDILKVWVGNTKESIPEGGDLRILVETFRDIYKAKGKMEFWRLFNAHLTNRSNTVAQTTRTV
jgi:hypothetical protein